MGAKHVINLIGQLSKVKKLYKPLTTAQKAAKAVSARSTRAAKKAGTFVQRTGPKSKHKTYEDERVHINKMQKVRVERLIGKYGIRKTSEMLGLDYVTIWRWIKDRREVTIELEKGKPVAYSIRKLV